MALTQERIQYYQDIIKNTGAQRESMIVARDVPKEYSAHLERVVRTTAIVDVPAVKLPVTIYLSVSKEKEPDCQVHINLHGGGFYFGHSEDDDLYCARVADELKGIVVDVDYALCPDHPFPAAFEQCYESVRWTFGKCAEWGADPKRVSLGGQSAGGNLSASVALRAASSGDFKLCLQVLDYAALDLFIALEEKNGTDGIPGKTRGAAFSMLYSDGDIDLLKTHYVSPCFAPDGMMEGLAPACVVSAGKCPFCLNNEEYGMRLASNGIETTLRRFRESRHGFTVRMLDEWQDSQKYIIQAIRKAGLREPGNSAG